MCGCSARIGDYSVIIPAYNEAGRIDGCLQNVRGALPDAEVIVADGGSNDGTPEIASSRGARIVRSNPGRGIQCNAGARAAGRSVLLFLHADTRLPADAAASLDNAFRDAAVQVGTFRLRFDANHWFLRLCGYLTRFDTVFTRFGDQCIVVRAAFFKEAGGFPEWPLFEDMHFLRAVRKRTRLYSFPLEVTTSARRFEKEGVYRQQLRNAVLIVRYLMGADVRMLAGKYTRGGRPC